MVENKSAADFALKIYDQSCKLAGSGQKNVIISPLSITLALANTYAGTGGNTKSQLKQVLLGNSSSTDENLHSSFSKIMSELNQPSAPYKLQIANRLYAHEPLVNDLRPEFLEILSKYYDSKLFAKNFATQGEQARQEINGWVSETTNNKINDLLPPGSLTGDSRLVIVNAIYFKGKWKNTFKTESTKERPFYVAENKDVQIPMMHKWNKDFHYTENDDCQVLGMPYEGDKLAMYFFLPKERYGLEKFEKQLNGEKVLELIDNSSNEEISELAIPKFKMELSLSLAKALHDMGASDMFSSGLADFSNINGRKDLFVSDVIHKAFIEVNEEGTEAAAATAVSIMLYSLTIPLKQVNFIADHPFIFAIVDKTTMTILFTGRFCG